ncbi:MAG: hypothetical protein Q6363_007085 [Candidatus Njordarchaeota archaeon]
MSKKVDDLVDALFARDTDFLKYMIKKRKKHGMILAILGIIIMLSPLVAFILLADILPFLVPPITDFGSLLLIFMIAYFIGFKLVQYGIIVRKEAANILNPGAGRYVFYSKLECPKCGFEYIRERKPGEFVGDTVEETCQKCGRPMRISGIYAEPEKKIEPIGYPLVAIPGQSVTLSIKAAIMDKLTPFKLAFRSKEKNDNKED